MALLDYNEYLDRLIENRAVDFQMSQAVARTNRLTALWGRFLPAPLTPAISVALDKNSAQSLAPMIDVSTGRLTMLGGRLNSSGISATGLVLMDLLNVSGGLDGTITTPQTTNLPTATLTRYTSGEGVMAGIVIYTQVSSTTTTITVSYTNQAGVSGRISTATTFGGTNFREIFSLLPIPLQAGDTGIRSVESVTLSASSGQVANFGICLYKPLAMISLESTTGQAPLDAVSSGCIIGSLCEIHPDACLTFGAISNSLQSFSGSVILAEV
jgi:hypothetical protein